MPSEYKHLPVQGLPPNLLQAEGGTVAAIALMQRKAGLNRESKRDLQSGTKSKWGFGQTIAATISKTDRNVLTFYLSASDRWGSFWSATRTSLRRRSPVGTKAYAVAIDIQLLNAYAPDWPCLLFDISALKPVCLEWENIQNSLERFWKEQGKEPMPFGVFMLWPRLVEDLQRWSTLDVEFRIRASNAIFSLSSIGWTRWFIDEAISICPELKQELGELSSQSLASSASLFNNEDPAVQLNEEAIPSNRQDESSLIIESTWATIGEELLGVVSENGK